MRHGTASGAAHFLASTRGALIGVAMLAPAMLCASPTWAAGGECDRLAGSPTDPDRVAPGVPIARIDAAAAIAACVGALASDSDNPRLAFNLGRAREQAGEFPEAAGLYKAAADRGHVVAALNLGLFLMQGHGAPRDVGAAFRLFKFAADKGFASAQLQVGLLYRNGAEGVPKDEREAARYFGLAAD